MLPVIQGENELDKIVDLLKQQTAGTFIEQSIACLRRLTTSEDSSAIDGGFIEEKLLSRNLQYSRPLI